MNAFQPFVMERMMSKFEQAVDYNLSESGVHPLVLREFLAMQPGMLEVFLDFDLNYPHANGNPDLRQNIARLYDGATPDNVLVTIGAIEANYASLLTVTEPGDEIVVMLPNYMQIWGAAQNSGLQVKTFHLDENANWAPDLDELREQVTPNTKLIALCNPNNPTGRILSPAEMDAIVAIAESVGAWILADEVYAGAERLTDDQAPSFYGRYDKVLATGSMSKAYGMPGLRLGWVVCPPETVDDIWARHEYIAIAAAKPSNHLAAMALSPQVRPRILARTRGYIRRGYPILKAWMDSHPGLFDLTPPDAAAICFVRYHLDINSTEFTERLRKEKSVLIVPGDHFGIDHHLRISFGLPENYLTPALDRIHDLIEELSPNA